MLRDEAITHMKSAIGASFVEQMGWGESKPMAALQAYGVADKQAIDALDALLGYLDAHTEEWEKAARQSRLDHGPDSPINTLVAALRGTTEEPLVEGREVWWCEEHEAEGVDQAVGALGYCWHSFYLNQMATMGEPCRMVRMILIAGDA